MQGKIKFKLNKDPFFYKRKYQVFVDDKLQGQLCNQNNKLDIVADYGHHNITIKGKKYSENIPVDLRYEDSIHPVHISHKPIYGMKIPNIWRNVSKGISIILASIMIYNFVAKNDVLYSAYIPLILVLFCTNFNEKEFNISLKKV